jgi:quaternary ammonium compound-resistance protein SugE
MRTVGRSRALRIENEEFSKSFCGSRYLPKKDMNWFILIIAGVFEIAFASCLGKAKETTGNEMYLWYVGFLITLIISMVLLIKATQSLPIGTAYAVWTGIGAVGTAIMGILVFKDPASFWRVFFLITLIGSIIGLKAVSH